MAFYRLPCSRNGAVRRDIVRISTALGFDLEGSGVLFQQGVGSMQKTGGSGVGSSVQDMIASQVDPQHNRFKEILWGILAPDLH